MRFLRQNTATVVTVGPFYDVTDGVTPETALTVTNFTAAFITDDDDGTDPSATVLTITATGGSNDMAHVSHGSYSLEFTAAQLNQTGRAMLHIYDTSDVIPVFHEFMILPQNVFDALFGGGNGQTLDYLQVDSIQASGSSTAMDNLEVVYDTDFATNYNTTDNAWVVDLQDDAITSAKYDQLTAHPVPGAITVANNCVDANLERVHDDALTAVKPFDTV